jgi:hypothetical protein
VGLGVAVVLVDQSLQVDDADVRGPQGFDEALKAGISVLGPGPNHHSVAREQELHGAILTREPRERQPPRRNDSVCGMSPEDAPAERVPSISGDVLPRAPVRDPLAPTPSMLMPAGRPSRAGAG